MTQYACVLASSEQSSPSVYKFRVKVQETIPKKIRTREGDKVGWESAQL